MNTDSQAQPAVKASPQLPVLRVFGVGNAGIQILEGLIRAGLPAASCVAVNMDAAGLDGSAAPVRVQLETKLLRGLGSGGDPERGRTMAEEHAAQLKEHCAGANVVFIVCGLGGGAGTGISPVLARLAKEAGALVLAFVTLPFACEGGRRERLAREGLEELNGLADGTVCLPNQAILKLIDENTSLVETFRTTNELMADGVRGIWRLLVHRGLIELHFNELCNLLRDQHSQSAFAVAEAVGPTRSREVIDRLLAHPLLNGGRALGESDTVLVSLVGGPDLTMAEVNRVVNEIGNHCEDAQVLVGAAVDDAFQDRLAVTLIAASKASSPPPRCRPSSGEVEPLDSQLLSQTATPRPGSRFVAPPPTLTQERMEQMMARQPRSRKAAPRMRQGQLPLEIISKGRFDKSEPTIHKGEDLDVPTYIRRGLVLN